MVDPPWHTNLDHRQTSGDESNNIRDDSSGSNYQIRRRGRHEDNDNESKWMHLNLNVASTQMTWLIGYMQLNTI